MGKETLFKRKCRLHQSWFREEVLKLDMGENLTSFDSPSLHDANTTLIIIAITISIEYAILFAIMNY